jgi:hypothetical protein
MDKITRDLEIRSRHRTQSALLPPERTHARAGICVIPMTAIGPTLAAPPHSHPIHPCATICLHLPKADVARWSTHRNLLSRNHA